MGRSKGLDRIGRLLELLQCAGLGSCFGTEAQCELLHRFESTRNGAVEDLHADTDGHDYPLARPEHE